MVLFVLRPEQFGGEALHSDTVPYLIRGYNQNVPGTDSFSEMWVGEFDLPVS